MKAASKQRDSTAQGITNPPRPAKRLYSITDAAAYLGRSEWAIRELVWKGALPAVKADRRIHLDVLDLDAFIEQNKVTFGG